MAWWAMILEGPLFSNVECGWVGAVPPGLWFTMVFYIMFEVGVVYGAREISKVVNGLYLC